jgi:hypothetical protein
MFTDFNTGIFCGTGIIQDGNILTSGTCPMEAKLSGISDYTADLTQKLIQEIKAKTR